MTPLPQISAAVAPLGAAALLLAAKTVGEPLGLTLPTVQSILEATGASRSRAYELAGELRARLPALVRPVGRPRVERGDAPATGSAESISAAVLRHLMAHPGAATAHGRKRHYSDGFRHFVVELRRAHEDVELVDFARAAQVPLGTLKSWVAASSAPSTSDGDQTAVSAETPRSDARTTTATGAQIESVLAAFDNWHGSFVGFCAYVRNELRIPWGRSVISDVLETHRARQPKRRPGRSPDERALRGAFECFFPGAQWVGDGKTVTVSIDGEPFRFNLELDVDAYSGAFTGMSIRPTEDSEAVTHAFDDGIATTGAAPIAMLLDNKPSNHSPEVDAALGDTLRLRATTQRPQNKAHVEGAFGLFSQASPPLELPWPQTRRQLAELSLRLVATTWGRTVNHRPRADRGGRSRVDLYGDQPTQEQIDSARRALEERLAKQERARTTAEARQRPEVKSVLDEAFERLELADPERHFRLAIARYPLDAIVAGIAIFESKKRAGTLPDDADARYLLGIVKNVSTERELTILADVLLQRRLEARDTTLATLADERDALVDNARTDDQLVADLVDRTLLSDRTIDRTFWLDALAQHVADAPAGAQHARYRAAASRIGATFRAPPRDRQHALLALAERLQPLS